MVGSRAPHRVIMVVAVAGLGIAVGGAGPPPAAVPTPPSSLTSDLPPDPSFDEKGLADEDRPFFNDFSWRLFVALSWPADPDRRGVPHPTKKFGDLSGPVVWESWKSLGELFPEDPLKHPPTPWGSFDAVLSARVLERDGRVTRRPFPGLPEKGAGRGKVLSDLPQLRLRDINQAGFSGEHNPPLVAQNKTFVRYEARVNRVAYDFVRDGQYFLKQKLPDPDGVKPLEFPDWSVNVKAAWMELSEGGESDHKRFYHLRAKVADWAEDGSLVLRDRTMGLVGLHIAVKTPRRKGWIWSTFEHVDNTDRCSGVGAPLFSSKAPPPPPNDPAANHLRPEDRVRPGTPLPKDPIPVEVVRLTPVHPATERVNYGYRNHVQVRDTVWRYYRLVGTQWPKPPGDGDPVTTQLPTALANVTMETYTQRFSCMTCHKTAMQSQMVFYPEVRGYPPDPPKAGGP